MDSRPTKLSDSKLYSTHSHSSDCTLSSLTNTQTECCSYSPSHIPFLTVCFASCADILQTFLHLKLNESNIKEWNGALCYLPSHSTHPTRKSAARVVFVSVPVSETQTASANDAGGVRFPRVTSSTPCSRSSVTSWFSPAALVVLHFVVWPFWSYILQWFLPLITPWTFFYFSWIYLSFFFFFFLQYMESSIYALKLHEAVGRWTIDMFEQAT